MPARSSARWYGHETSCLLARGGFHGTAACRAPLVFDASPAQAAYPMHAWPTPFNASCRWFAALALLDSWFIVAVNAKDRHCITQTRLVLVGKRAAATHAAMSSDRIQSRMISCTFTHKAGQDKWGKRAYTMHTQTGQGVERRRGTSKLQRGEWARQYIVPVSALFSTRQQTGWFNAARSWSLHVVARRCRSSPSMPWRARHQIPAAHA